MTELSGINKEINTHKINKYIAEKNLGKKNKGNSTCVSYRKDMVHKTYMFFIKYLKIGSQETLILNFSFSFSIYI